MYGRCDFQMSRFTRKLHDSVRVFSNLLEKTTPLKSNIEPKKYPFKKNEETSRTDQFLGALSH